MADENELVPADQGDAPGGGSADIAINQDEIEALLNETPNRARAAQDGQTPSSTQVAQSSDEEGADDLLGQSEIEKLLGNADPSTVPTGATDADATRGLPAGGVDEADIDCLFDQAQEALRSIDQQRDLPPGTVPFEFREFAGAQPNTDSATLDLISDVELDLKIELGRTHMYLEDVLKLRRGAVVPLDKLAGDPVDIYVNGRLIARGEVLVLNDNFCVRVAELIAGSKVGSKEPTASR